MTNLNKEHLEFLKIEHLFLEIVLETAKINPAFMNWVPASITEAVQKYKFKTSSTVVGVEPSQLHSFICYQQNTDFIEILALGTLKKYQNRGLSEHLLRQFMAECVSASKLVTLEVHSQNQSAIALYTKCGFRKVRTRKNYYADGADALVMDVDLQIQL